MEQAWALRLDEARLIWQQVRYDAPSLQSMNRSGQTIGSRSIATLLEQTGNAQVTDGRCSAVPLQG